MNLIYAHNHFLNKEMPAKAECGIPNMIQLKLMLQQQQNQLYHNIEKRTN